MKQLGHLLTLVFFLGLCCGGCVPKAKVTVRIVGDNNETVPDATVFVNGFNTKKEGKTDKDGLFIAKLRNPTGQLDLMVKKDGFYTIWWYSYFFKTHINGQWVPWNPTVELQLHKKGNPVPMVVKKVDEKDIPAVNREVGYDLLVGDWVEPQGKGKMSDFIIQIIKPTSTNEFMRLLLKFSNPSDGLIKKRLFYRDDYELRLPAIAPENGYSNHWEFQACDGEPTGNPGWNVLKNGDQDANFYFRVRTKTNQQGTLESAMYGKIYWGIQFGSATYPETTPLHFLYYLNPDGTRNTEFDARSNLCAKPGDYGGQP
jgi:hypothetical protein